VAQPLSRIGVFGFLVAGACATYLEAAPSADRPQADIARFEKDVAPVFAKICVHCHGPKKAKGRFRVDTLDPDLLVGGDVDRWLEVFSVLSNAEMPPEDKDDYAISDAARANMIEWLGAEIQKAANARRDEGGHSSFRRLSKYEYNYALGDLLGLPYDFAGKLPPETTSEDGFKNSSDRLRMTAMQFETYRKIGLEALGKAIVSGERPKPVTYVDSMREQMEKASKNEKAKFIEPDEKGRAKKRRYQHIFDRESGKGLHYKAGRIEPDPDAVTGKTPEPSSAFLFLPPKFSLKYNLGHHLPDTGTMRVSIRVGRTTHEPDEFVVLRLIFGAHTSNNANFSQRISQRDLPVTAPADKPEFVHFDIPLSEIPRNPFRKNKETFPRRDELLTIQSITNAKRRKGKEELSIHVDHIEITAPYYDEWPPESHTSIFAPKKNATNEQVYGEDLLIRFMERAWSRPVSRDDAAPYFKLLSDYRPEVETFEQAMIEVLGAVLSAPEFLYLIERAPAGDRDSKTISDHELARRLSFFLWSSIPDSELLTLARDENLRDPEVLSAQVKRMLSDPRAERFSRHFVEGWLGLDGLDSVDHIRDSDLATAMSEEPVAFFDEVLSENRSVLDFLHSDFVVVNEKLARHYGISEVYGPQFRPVKVAADKNRGGILTSAAVLAMNSDGEDSHPLKRGVWLLEHILDDPPPPPPPDVPEVDLTDPEILKMTLKERIADHRNKPACLSCHRKIDPWGIAFENYDAMGSYRTQIKNEPVDATATLPNQQELAGMDGLKRYLLVERQDQFTRALVHKMVAYALGRPLSFGDRADIGALTLRFRKSGDRLGYLVQMIVASDLFRAKRS